MPDMLSSTTIVIGPMPTAHFGPGAVGALPGIVQRAGADAAVIVTDAALAATPVVPTVAATLESGGITAVVFSGVQPNPSTADVAVGADAVAALAAESGRVMLVAVGGGSAIDAAKGIALADFDQIAADALDDEVMANTPRMPTGRDIREILAASAMA